MVETPRAVNQIPTTGQADQKEVKATRVVKRRILEDQTTEVTMSGYDVVCFFFLSELVSIVLGLLFCGFTNE